MSNVLRIKVFILNADSKLSHFSQLTGSQDLEAAKKELPGNAYAFTFYSATRNPHGRGRGRFSNETQCSPIYDKTGAVICQKEKDQAFLDAQKNALEAGLPNSLRKP